MCGRGIASRQSIAKYPDYFPPLVSQMVAVGETTGKIEEMFTRLSGIYTREADEITNNLVDLIQPVLMIGIGLMVGFFLPRYLSPFTISRIAFTKCYNKKVNILKGRERFLSKEHGLSTEKGFTLIEILIVVAIIAILASVVLVGLGPTQSGGRDARRVSDLSEVQNGFELYYNKSGHILSLRLHGRRSRPISRARILASAPSRTIRAAVA